MMSIRKKTEEGFALLLAIIISSVMLAIGVSVLKISVNQVNLATTARESEFAFQAAHAGVDCLAYWRNESAISYTRILTYDQFYAQSMPPINCFGFPSTAAASSRLRLQNDEGHSSTDVYFYDLDWGSPVRCTRMRMTIVNAYGADLAIPYPSPIIGNSTAKICKAGTICNYIVSDGYNRSCDETDSSIFSIQREIVYEF